MPKSMVNIAGQSGANKGVSRFMFAEDRAWWQVVGEQGNDLTDAEINLMQASMLHRFSELVQAVSQQSGWYQANLFTFGGGFTATQFGMPDTRANVQGAVVRVANPGAAAKSNTLTLAAKPGGGSRTDTVFLEAWLQEVAYAGASNAADANVYTYGGVGNTVATNDVFDTNVAAETTRRVQLRWRLRAIAGVNAGTSPNGLGDAACTVQGAQGAPIAGVAFVQNPTDPGLWWSGDGIKAQIAPPTTVLVTPTGTPGATNYSYRVTAYYLGPNGEYSETSTTVGTTSTGNATLTGGNYNALSWTAVVGVTGYKVYGRSGGGELLMATIPAGTTVFNDTGAVTPAGAYPTINTTGGGALFGTADGYVYAIPIAVIARTAAEASILTAAVTDVRKNAASWPYLGGGSLSLSGVVTATNFISTVAVGSQPYAATSTTVNTNLNADMVDGVHAAGFDAAGAATGVQTNLTNHINAIATSGVTVHGIRQGSGNAFDADTVDGLHASQLDTSGAAGAVNTALNAHIATTASSATTVHGIRMGSGHGFDADTVDSFNTTAPGGKGNANSSRIPITGSDGAAGAAQFMSAGDGTTFYPPTTPGGAQANATSITNAAGRTGIAALADNATAVGGAQSSAGNPTPVGTVPIVANPIDAFGHSGLFTNVSGFASHLMDPSGTVRDVGVSAGAIAYVQSDGKIHNDITGVALGGAAQITAALQNLATSGGPSGSAPPSGSTVPLKIVVGSASGFHGTNGDTNFNLGTGLTTVYYYMVQTNNLQNMNNNAITLATDGGGLKVISISMNPGKNWIYNLQWIAIGS